MSDEIIRATIYQPRRIPNVYRPPLGLPLNWKDETSRQLRSAVFKFFSYQKLSPDEISLVAEYCQHYINAPYWDTTGGFPDELAALRESAATLSTVDQVGQWINGCLEIAIDPF
jgi:hypothetical protein